MKIAVSSDHRGRYVADQIARLLIELGHEVLASMPVEGEPSDYPDKAAEVGRAVKESGIARDEFFITTKVPCCPGSAFSPGIAIACLWEKNTTKDFLKDLDVLQTFRRERVKIIHSNPELRHHLESNLVVELNVRGVAMGTDATLGNWRGGAEDRRRTAGENRLGDAS